MSKGDFRGFDEHISDNALQILVCNRNYYTTTARILHPRLVFGRNERSPPICFVELAGSVRNSE